MKVSELSEKIKGIIISGSGEKELDGCYIGDLLSLAMSKVQENNIWITIQTNINSIAVASLTEAGCIVVCEGFTLDENALEKAKDEVISVILSEMSAFEIARLI